MRTIKFRAWDKEEKKMVVPSDLFDPYNIPVEPDDVGFSLKSKFILMQFTSLLDKNGKEIWGSDIITHTWEGLKGYNQHTGDEIMEKIVDVGEVVFEEGAFRLKSKPENPWNLACLSDLESIEVIGDIYSTPSLLNEK